MFFCKTDFVGEEGARFADRLTPVRFFSLVARLADGLTPVRIFVLLRLGDETWCFPETETALNLRKLNWRMKS